MEQLLDRWLPHTVAVAAIACSVYWQPPMDTAILVLGFCVPAVCGARLLQEFYLDWRRGDADPATPAPPRKVYQRLCCALLCSAMVAVVLVLVKRNKNHDLELLERLWSLPMLLGKTAIVAVLLAVAFELSGSPVVELADALSRGQKSYSEGAAWLFFLGYLEIIFGDEGARFSVRMEDYLTSNGVCERDRNNTCKEKMFIIIPMTRVAMLSDNDFQDNDPTVSKERTLKEAAVAANGRKFGETRVYQVRQDGLNYRMAMEEATPMRTAALAVEDADADFDEAHYEAFAGRFLNTLGKILKRKPVIGSQVELVPIYEADQLGRTVVERLLKLKERDNERGQNRQEQMQEQE